MSNQGCPRIYSGEDVTGAMTPPNLISKYQKNFNQIQ